MMKGKFGCESWLKYFKPSEDKGIKFQKLITNNERCLDYLTKYIPRYIDSILQFGCASGRDFIPFNEKYKLFGCDLAPKEKIEWVQKFQNLEYYECRIENFEKLIEISENFKNLSKFFIYTQGTMMYVEPNNQEKFFNLCLKHKCKNFIFHEINKKNFTDNDNPSLGYDGKYFSLNDSHPEFFIEKNYRNPIEKLNPTAHIHLDVDEQIKKQILEEEI